MRWALAMLVMSSGCKGPPGELDPDVVNSLSREVGDADGFDLTGTYQAEVAPVMCGCPVESAASGLSLCAATALGTAQLINVNVVQTDGILLLRYMERAITGPVNDDGSFVTAGVLDMTSVVSSGHTIVRIDGDFTGDDFGEIDADLRQRFAGSVILPDLQEIELNCTEHVSIAATKFR